MGILATTPEKILFQQRFQPAFLIDRQVNNFFGVRGIQHRITEIPVYSHAIESFPLQLFLCSQFSQKLVVLLASLVTIPPPTYSRAKTNKQILNNGWFITSLANEGNRLLDKLLVHLLTIV